MLPLYVIWMLTFQHNVQQWWPSFRSRVHNRICGGKLLPGRTVVVVVVVVVVVIAVLFSMCCVVVKGCGSDGCFLLFLLLFVMVVIAVLSFLCCVCFVVVVDGGFKVVSRGNEVMFRWWKRKKGVEKQSLEQATSNGSSE